mmetsp:Transcript_34577/g.75457  ORF Transcript_34577/g.75457 Transcript_34577/m.75457 type:complete len:205 (+) Transcript_34577:680-1294(+)
MPLPGVGRPIAPALGTAGAGAAAGAAAAAEPVAGPAGAAACGMPDMRYSTALSGLLNAARRASRTLGRSKPMAASSCTRASGGSTANGGPLAAGTAAAEGTAAGAGTTAGNAGAGVLTLPATAMKSPCCSPISRTSWLSRRILPLCTSLSSSPKSGLIDIAATTRASTSSSSSISILNSSRPLTLNLISTGAIGCPHPHPQDGR